MSKLVKAGLPCPSCSSSDAFSIYDDGHGYCFSCQSYVNDTNSLDIEFGSVYNGTTFKAKENKLTSLDQTNKELTEVYTSLRGINIDTRKKYGSSVFIDKTGKPVKTKYPYGASASKVRDLVQKDFRSEGNMKDAGLFGQDIFSPGMAEAIIITEGEEDAMAAYQMVQGSYPCVSVKSSSQAVSDCKKAAEFINSFNKIYIAFDNDAPGQKAAKEVSSLFNVNKVYHVVFGDNAKDANDYLINNRQKEFFNLVQNAEKYRPKGIISSSSQIKEALAKDTASAKVASYPFSNLDELTYGIRIGEVNLFLAQEKVGKTEVMRAIEHHLIKTTDYNIGIIHLEEQERRSICGLVGYEVNKPAHLPDSGLSNEDIFSVYEKMVKKEDRVFIYTHFGSDDPDSILDTIRYLVAVSGCKFIFLDHITMLVTGTEDDDERRKLDYISTRLATMTRELGFTLFLVSHVNDNGQARGSRNIPKIADLIVFISRDIEAEDVETRNTTNMVVRGNRFAGTTGPVKPLWFNPKTYTLAEKNIVEGEIPEVVNEF